MQAPWMHPTGWFMVGWSNELEPGGLRTVPFFGDDMILYRTEGGALHGLDARCRHLGAHLGQGRIEAECVVCPFHGWRWGPDGTNCSIPGTEQRNRSQRLATWPVCERNGITYVWHDATGGGPTWELPDLFATIADDYPAGPFHEPYPEGAFRYESLTIQPRVVAENIVDVAHFQHVHRTRDAPQLIEHEVTPISFRTRLRVPSRGKRDIAPTRDDTVTLMMFGVGIGYTRFSGRDNSHSIIAVTPIDDTRSTLYQTIWVEQLDGETPDAKEARLRAIASVFPEDLEIWRTQRFLDTPALSGEEARLFGAMRKWARSFEPKDLPESMTG